MFKEVWGEDAKFQKIVEEVWKADVHGIEMFKLVKKLWILKEKVKVLNLESYSHLKEKTETARKKLETAQELLSHNHFDGELIARERSL